VTIKNWKLGSLHYLIQLGILFYIIGWVIVIKQGYQGVGPLIGSSNIKAKGNAYYQTNDSFEIWDEYDAVYPFKEQDAFFITTNFEVTYNQSRGTCYSDSSPQCNATNPCPVNASTGMGITNGTCSDDGYCWLRAWCPQELDNPPNQLLVGIPDFTVFVKVNVKFPTYGVLVDNVGYALTPGVNFWSIGDMLSSADVSYESVNVDGTVIAVIVEWDCDLDKPTSDCTPSFTFTRIDNPSQFSPGFNFRYAHYYWIPSSNMNGPVPGRTEYRDLFKVYGIRFVYMVSGQARKFDIIPLMLNFGSGLALLGIATVVTDLLVLYVVPNKKFYQTMKYTKINKDINSQTNEKTPLLP